MLQSLEALKKHINMGSSEGPLLMRLSFNQISDGFLENMTSTLRGCIETRT